MTHTGLGITFVRVARLSPQNRKLNSDQLGKKGEDRFSELCSDAGLVCNKSTYDRTGWDFIVEFLFDSDPKVTLDKRQAPLSCPVSYTHLTLPTILRV